MNEHLWRNSQILDWIKDSVLAEAWERCWKVKVKHFSDEMCFFFFIHEFEKAILQEFSHLGSNDTWFADYEMIKELKTEIGHAWTDF